MSLICIVAATFYEDITAELVRGATTALDEAGAHYELIEVPGVFEVPSALQMALDSGRFDGFVALGCVIRGETSHYDIICHESAHGLMQLALRHKAAIGNGILTVEDEKQAWARAKVKEGNKGAAAARACLALLKVRKRVAAT